MGATGSPWTEDERAASEIDEASRNQAEQLATAAGVELGDVLRISESSPDVGPAQTPTAAADSSVAQRMIIEPGSEELTVQVSVVFSIR